MTKDKQGVTTPPIQPPTSPIQPPTPRAQYPHTTTRPESRYEKGGSPPRENSSIKRAYPKENTPPEKQLRVMISSRCTTQLTSAVSKDLGLRIDLTGLEIQRRYLASDENAANEVLASAESHVEAAQREVEQDRADVSANVKLDEAKSFLDKAQSELARIKKAVDSIDAAIRNPTKVSRQSTLEPADSPESYTLSDLRKLIRDEVAGYRLGSVGPLFSVWINEGALSEPLSSTARGVCLEKVRTSQITIVLYTGEPGSIDDSGTGICLEEAETAFATSPNSTFVIDVRRLVILSEDNKSGAVNKNQELAKKTMDDWFKSKDSFQSSADSLDSLLALVNRLLVKSTIGLALDGHSGTAGRGAKSQGTALRWSKLSITDLQKEMVSAIGALINFTSGRDAPELGHAKLGTWSWEELDYPLSVIVSAVPGAMANVEPRSLWGRPDQAERAVRDMLGSVYGPIHIVAVRDNITELQARKLLSSEHSIAFYTDFGIFAADKMSGRQFFFLKNCVDPTSTLRELKAAKSWVIVNKESREILERSKRRKEFLEIEIQ